MSFFKENDSQETIAAVATPPGEGGVAIIRISGSLAIEVGSKICQRSLHSYQTHVLHFEKFKNSNNDIIDEGLIVVMKKPRSYTGEDTVEIHCHGGQLLTRKMLETVLKAGARLAMPGEFTLRAYMNGKIDLAQAAAVQEVISAKNDLALQVAQQQLKGLLSNKIRDFQQCLIDQIALLEAWIDFPEEDLEKISLEQMILELESLAHRLENLISTFDDGRKICEGLKLCILGAPNVGKSSLMNALLGVERSIVTSIPGTTRDIIREDIKIGEIHFRLIDTAGIRESSDIVEQEGVRRSYQEKDDADFILLVIDASQGFQPIDSELIESLAAKKFLIVWNKIDLPFSKPCPEEAVAISVKEEFGLQNLKQKIYNRIWTQGIPSKEEIMITNVRHHDALTQASYFLKMAIEGLKNRILFDLVVFELRQSLKKLGTIIGIDITEEILSSIFSKFCIGK